MSKIYDIEKMYGQDFNMVTTNGPSNIIRKSKNLLPNTFLISSPEDTKGGQDNNFPSLFVTDYTGEPLQLTYPLLMKYGLNYNSSLGCAFINIDNSTIVTEDTNGKGPLMVNTNNLSLANTKRRGTVKVSENIQLLNRNLENVNEKYNTKTFIKINSNGVLYIDNSFIDLIDNLVNLKIKSKLDSIKLMVNNNLKMWINVKLVNSNKINLIYNINSSIDSIDLSKIGDYSYSVDEVEYVSKNSPIIMFFDLHYYSFNNESESINIKYDNIPNIYSIDFSNSNMTTVNPIPNNDELYEHVLENIRIIFLPNYFLNNNKSISQYNNILFSVDNVEYGKIEFTQSPLSNINMKIDNTLTETENNSDNKSINISISNNTFKQCNIKEGDSIINLFNYSVVGYFEGKNYSKSTEYIQSLDDKINNSGNIEIELIQSEDFSNFLKNECYIDGENPSINTKSNYVYSKIGEDETIINYIKFVVEFVIKSKNKTISSWKESYDINLKLASNESRILMNINTNNVNSSSPKRLMRSISLMSSTGNSTSIEANNYNVPNHFYYNLRSNNGRMYLNNQYEYNGEDINPDVLYCIIKDDMVYSDDNCDNALFKIKNSGYKLIKYEGDKIINDSIDYSLIKLDYDSYNKIENGYIEFDLGKNNSDRIRNNNMLLSNGLSIPVKTQSNNKATQTLQINVNILELLLNNTFIKQKYNNSLEKLSGPQYISNELNYNNELYYNMNNYVITDNINNNEIEYIKFIVPYYVINSLSNDNYMNITFGFPDKSGNINKSIIQIKKSNSQINSVILNNLKDNILSLENSQFDIDFEDKNNNYIILKHKNSGKILPKLLFIKFNFSFNDDIVYKICYITDTNKIPTDGAKLKLIENSEKAKAIKLYYDESENIYNIICGFKPESNSIKNVLNPRVNQDGIIVENLILNSNAIYNYTNGDISNEDKSNFNIIFGLDNNDNILLDINWETANTVYAYFNYDKPDYDNCYDYNTYVNINNSLDPILPYKIRFDAAYLDKKNEVELDDNIIYSDNNNTIYNFNTPLSGLSKSPLDYIKYYIQSSYSLYYNGNSNKTNINKIDYVNINTGEKLNNSSNITRNDNIGLYLNNIIINNNLVNNLSLNRDIKYTKISWGGLTFENNNILDSNQMYIFITSDTLSQINIKPLLVDNTEIPLIGSYNSNSSNSNSSNNTNVLLTYVGDVVNLSTYFNTNQIYSYKGSHYVGLSDYLSKIFTIKDMGNYDATSEHLALSLYNPTFIPNKENQLLYLNRDLCIVYDSNFIENQGLVYIDKMIGLNNIINYAISKNNYYKNYYTGRELSQDDCTIHILSGPIYNEEAKKYEPIKLVFKTITNPHFWNGTNTEGTEEIPINYLLYISASNTSNNQGFKIYNYNDNKENPVPQGYIEFTNITENEIYKFDFCIRKGYLTDKEKKFKVNIIFDINDWYDSTKDKYINEINIKNSDDSLPKFKYHNTNINSINLIKGNDVLEFVGNDYQLKWKDGKFPTEETDIEVIVEYTIDGIKISEISDLLKFKNYLNIHVTPPIIEPTNNEDNSEGSSSENLVTPTEDDGENNNSDDNR